MEFNIGDKDSTITAWAGGYDLDGFWKPTKDGLGMAHCIEELNKIYGKEFIKL